MAKGGAGWWQATKIGAGAVPIETSEGWLLFYHGVSGTCNGFVYSFGAAILDINNPSKVLYRTRDYILTPEKEYETTGFVPNVAFPCATLHDAETGRIAIYYGAADSYVGLAFTQFEDIVEYIKKNSVLTQADTEIGKR
jgi:beta-1,4-mannooligosaccharide/beta-1,4-mannosyl-N-acetylglucosamine phosphorylase